nr:immunoglobulin light chain junction region [Macaca mulatta]MOW31877.1 immunoglobulin light chain junction region [Macaca mulatta]
DYYCYSTASSGNQGLF